MLKDSKHFTNNKCRIRDATLQGFSLVFSSTFRTYFSSDRHLVSTVTKSWKAPIWQSNPTNKVKGLIFVNNFLTSQPPAKTNKFPPGSKCAHIESFQAFDHAGSSVSFHPGHGMKTCAVRLGPTARPVHQTGLWITFDTAWRVFAKGIFTKHNSRPRAT